MQNGRITYILPVEGLDVLSVPFTQSEIDSAVAEMPTDKAPGPDGFNVDFLQGLLEYC